MNVSSRLWGLGLLALGLTGLLTHQATAADQHVVMYSANDDTVNIADPRPPSERKKGTVEVATPMSRASVAFWTATSMTGMVMPMPIPSRPI